MSSDDKFVWSVILGTVLTLIMIAIMLVLGQNWVNEYRCNQYEKISGTRTEYVFLDSCYIELDGRMTRWDEYSAKVIAELGLRNE